MRDLAMQAAGGLAVLTAAIHGVLGETTGLLLRLIWQCGTVAWIGFGVLLAATPYMGSEAARLWIGGAAIATYSVAAIGNAWVTRGRHVGWMAMMAVSVLALVGA